jgi:hypothetical protein
MSCIFFLFCNSCCLPIHDSALLFKLSCGSFSELSDCSIVYLFVRPSSSISTDNLPVPRCMFDFAWFFWSIKRAWPMWIKRGARALLSSYCIRLPHIEVSGLKFLQSLTTLTDMCKFLCEAIEDVWAWLISDIMLFDACRAALCWMVAGNKTLKKQQGNNVSYFPFIIHKWSPY